MEYLLKTVFWKKKIKKNTPICSLLTVKIILPSFLGGNSFLLTHCSGETPKRVIGKQCRMRHLIRVSTVCK